MKEHKIALTEVRIFIMDRTPTIHRTKRDYLSLAQRMLRLRSSMSTSKSKILIMLKHLLILAAVAGVSTGLFAQKPAWQPGPGHPTLSLWPNGAPGAAPNPAPEIDTTTAKDDLIAGKPLIRLGNVSVPTITLYAPKDKNTGAAVVVFPGGGYHILAIDLEGTEVCDWLNSIGSTVFCSSTACPTPDPIQNPPQHSRMRSALSESSACTPLSGISIHTELACLAFLRERILLPPSALISISACTTRSTRLTS